MVNKLAVALSGGCLVGAAWWLRSYYRRRLEPPVSAHKKSKHRLRWGRLVQKASTQRAVYSKAESAELHERVVIAMVGLPARGKSYISKAILRYLNFLGCPTKVFNAGNKRRDDGHAGTSAAFFDPANSDAKALKEQMAMDTLEDLFEWLRDARAASMLTTGDWGCTCGIFDATNTTVERRRKVAERCAAEQPPVRLIFVESICDDEELLQHNYRMKLANDDYQGATDAQAALADFVERVRQYEKVYQQVRPEEGLRYIQLVNAGEALVVAGCRGYVATRCLSLLHSIHLEPRCLWLVTCGETLSDVAGTVGGDAVHSAEGLAYARAAVRTLVARLGSAELKADCKACSAPPVVMTGTLRRYAQVLEMLRPLLKLGAVSEVARLNDICVGELDGAHVDRLPATHTKEMDARSRDTLNYRYPGLGGESYRDVIQRMLDVVLQIEQTREHVIVVCDRVVARILTAYLCGEPAASIPAIPMVRGIVELRRTHHGFVHSTLEVHGGRPRVESKAAATFPAG